MVPLLVLILRGEDMRSILPYIITLQIRIPCKLLYPRLASLILLTLSKVHHQQRPHLDLRVNKESTPTFLRHANVGYLYKPHVIIPDYVSIAEKDARV